MVASAVAPSIPAGNMGQVSRPISTVSNWVTACADPLNSDNAGSVVIAPNGIDRAAWFAIAGQGTTVQIRLKYLVGATINQHVVIQAFGRDANLVPQRLLDSLANHALTLTADATNDASDGTYRYTQPVEVDCDACKEVMVAVKTALGGSGLGAPVILIRNK